MQKEGKQKNKFCEEISDLERHFNTFYCEYHSTNIMSYNEYLVVTKIPFGYATAVEKKCNELIERLGLPLVAKKNARNGIFYDTVVITELQK